MNIKGAFYRVCGQPKSYKEQKRCLMNIKDKFKREHGQPQAYKGQKGDLMHLYGKLNEDRWLIQDQIKL